MGLLGTDCQGWGLAKSSKSLSVGAIFSQNIDVIENNNSYKNSKWEDTSYIYICNEYAYRKYTL